MFMLRVHHWVVLGVAIACILGLTFSFMNGSGSSIKPHIIIVIADDMGRNDVGFHGSNQIPTPNIDSLGYNGIILDRFYTQCSCTPSRAALLTGNYPIRSGMQGHPLKAGENRSMPYNMPTMPEQLKKLGYKTHLVGKWHLGSAFRRSTPTGRGFDTHFGYWNGFISYFGQIAIQEMPDGSMMSGFDLHDKLRTAWKEKGKYTTDIFTEKSEEVIDKHSAEEPLFLMVSHLAPHTGKDGTELGVPDRNLTDIKYSYIDDPRRRLYADVVNMMDNSIGRIVKKLEEKHLLQNSIVLFFSDNGGQTVGTYENAASNWPLRGMKLSDFEGGVRVAGAIFSPLFQARGYVNKELIHLTDWLPTFYAAAGGDVKDLGQIDGVNQWDTLSKEKPSRRSEILLNIDELHNNSAIIADNGRFKVVHGTYFNGDYDQYFGDTGRGQEVPPYSIHLVLASDANRAIAKTTGDIMTEKHVSKLRKQTDLTWCRSDNDKPFINCKHACLFDLLKDPCETINIRKENPNVADRLLQRIEEFRKVMVLQKISVADPKANPKFYNGSWCTWLDDEVCVKTPFNNKI